jgi:rhamnose utilization protein RhaD (predicted bifunctional aldolase and dehydrogenase)
MTTHSEILTPAFRALSARLGQDPLQVQGPGGNTSIKSGNVMWIKASGTELADADQTNIFVAVDRDAAVAEAREQAGDGSCKTTGLDPNVNLRPSIETTFHAALDWPVIAHTHPVATLVHAISPEGRIALDQKLAGLSFVQVPYAKPGLPLTREILARIQPDTQVIVLQNHGLICCADSVEAVDLLIKDVEARLAMPAGSTQYDTPPDPSPVGFTWSDFSWMGQYERPADLATSGTYYPDHVVFLGPALPERDTNAAPAAILMRGNGVLIRDGATSSQLAMLRCLSDVLSRLPQDWSVDPIGPDAEAELLNWDAEKYRQALAEQH